jgi:guanylate kinase
MGHLYVVCGPPGAGKTTLLKAVASDDQLGLQPLRRTTTRQDRPYEGDSESQSGEYWFREQGAFAARLVDLPATNLIEWNGYLLRDSHKTH